MTIGVELMAVRNSTGIAAYHCMTEIVVGTHDGIDDMEELRLFEHDLSSFIAYRLNEIIRKQQREGKE